MSKKKAVHGVAVAREKFAHMGFKIVLKIGVEEVVEAPVAGFAGLTVGGEPAAGEVAGARHLAPLGVALGDVFLPDHGSVNRGADAEAVKGLDLLSEEIATGEGGVGGAGLGGVVALTVVALGEKCHAIDARAGKGVGEGVGVEFGGDVGNPRRSVEIEMNLTEWKG